MRFRTENAEDVAPHHAARGMCPDPRRTKAHLRVNAHDHDRSGGSSLLPQRASDGLDGILGRCLREQTWELGVMRFPRQLTIPLPLPPLGHPHVPADLTAVTAGPSSSNGRQVDGSPTADAHCRPSMFRASAPPR